MIKVKLFAHLREQFGQECLEIDAAGKSVTELKAILQENDKMPDIANVMVAINEEFVNDDQQIQDGDTVAFIPPVSGG